MVYLLKHSPRAFHQWVAGSFEFKLGVSHKQDALKDVSWNRDSDLNHMTDSSSSVPYPVKTDGPEDECEGGF